MKNKSHFTIIVLAMILLAVILMACRNPAGGVDDSGSGSGSGSSGGGGLTTNVPYQCDDPFGTGYKTVLAQLDWVRTYAESGAAGNPNIYIVRAFEANKPFWWADEEITATQNIYFGSRTNITVRIKTEEDYAGTLHVIFTGPAGHMFNVGSAAGTGNITLELYNIGMSGTIGTGPLIQVNENGILRMEESRLVRGLSSGRAVRVNGGKFIMKDGAIINDSYGGVELADGARLFLYGTAEIFQNHTASHGAGVLASGAGTSITMNGGAIRNHTAGGGFNGGGVHLSGGAVLNMNSGSIHQNLADNGGGVFVAIGTGSGINGDRTLIHTNGIRFGGIGIEIYD